MTTYSCKVCGHVYGERIPSRSAVVMHTTTGHSNKQPITEIRSPRATYKNWHAWENANPFAPRVLLSDEDNKQLRYFKSWDDAINWLYLNGNKEAARAINSQIKVDTVKKNNV